MEVVFDFLARFDGLIAISRGFRKAKTGFFFVFQKWLRA